MRAYSVDDYEVVFRNVAKFFQKPRHQLVTGERAGDIGDHDGDRIGSLYHLPQGWCSDWIPQSCKHCSVLIFQSMQFARFNDQRILRDIYFKIVPCRKLTLPSLEMPLDLQLRILLHDPFATARVTQSRNLP